MEKEIANEYNLTLLNSIDEARKKYKKGLKWVREELTPEKRFISMEGLVNMYENMYKNPDPSFFYSIYEINEKKKFKIDEYEEVEKLVGMRIKEIEESKKFKEYYWASIFKRRKNFRRFENPYLQYFFSVI